jgi:transposase
MPLNKPRDARSLAHTTLEELRRLGVKRVLAGETQAAVAASLEIHPGSVARWMAQYREGGEQSLASTVSTGRPSKLAPKQVAQLRGIIIGKNPQQLNFGLALWTLPVIRQLIERKFGVVLHDSNIGRLLHRIGLSVQRPQRRAFQRDDEECQRWASEVFPGIVRTVKRKQATLLFCDETGVHEDGPVGTTWGQKGETPVVRVSGTRRRINVISVISPRGRLWFRCYKGTLTAPRFIEFLQAMLRDIRGNIVLVLDKHPAHVAAATRRFIQANAKRLTVEHLPGYAPDMNPDEHVWSHLKGMFKRNPLEASAAFDEEVQETMEFIREDRALVRSFFGHPDVAYVKNALGW